jgi:hypothetical protein
LWPARPNLSRDPGAEETREPIGASVTEVDEKSTPAISHKADSGSNYCPNNDCFVDCGFSRASVLQEGSSTVDSSDRAIAKQVETKLQQDSIESAAGKSPVVSLDEHEVNSVVARMVQASLRQSQHVPDRASVRQLTIKLRNDILQAHFVLGIRETEVAFDMEGQLYTADGRLKFDPLSGRIGDLPVPRSILASAATKLLNSPAAHDRTVLPENISDLRVQNGTALPPHRKTLILSAC